jgi:predicted phage-related endonuclease
MTDLYPTINVQPSVDPVKERERFIAIRAPYFGTSVAACLFGQHPFMSAADYWLEKVAGTQQEVTEAMDRGHIYEPFVARWFCETMGWATERNTNMYVRGHLAATPDYWHGDELIEIKTTAMVTDQPADYWLWQVQGQMLCTGATRCHIAWVDGTLGLHNITVEADADMQARLWNASEEFMQGVENEVMADWIETEARHIIAMYPDPVDSIDAGDDGMNLVADYWHCKSQAKHYDEQAAELRDGIFNVAGNHDTIIHDGKEIATLRPRKLAARFDQRRFKEEHPGLFEDYMGEPTTTRALNIPKAIKAAIEGTN